MGTYISSKGEEKDTSTMPYTYIQNALNKATEEGNQANIDALSEELQSRPEYAEEASEADPAAIDIDDSEDTDDEELNTDDFDNEN